MFLFCGPLDEQLNQIMKTSNCVQELEIIVQKEENKQTLSDKEKEIHALMTLDYARIHAFGLHGENKVPEEKHIRLYVGDLDTVQENRNIDAYRGLISDLFRAMQEDAVFNAAFLGYCYICKIDINAFITNASPIKVQNKYGMRTALSSIIFSLAFKVDADLKGYDQKFWDLLKKDHLAAAKRILS